MGRKEPRGKIVKKWIQQGESLDFVANLLSCTPQEAYSDYLHYTKQGMYFGKTAINMVSDTRFFLKQVIAQNKSVHVYGNTGCGKTFNVKKIANELNLDVHVSYATLEEELAKDFGDAPLQQSDSLFLLEGDAYYWRKYGLIKNYIENSKAPFVIITIGKDTPTKNVTKLLQQVKIYPPTRSEVLELATTLNRNFDERDLVRVYDKDWRKVWRKIRFGTDSVKNKQNKFYDAKTLAYKLVKGEAVLEDFDNCSHPVSWVLNWLGYNAENFWKGKVLKYNFDIISWSDSNKYNFKQIYIKQALLQLIPTEVKGFMRFPPFKKQKKQEEEIGNYSIKKFKKTKAKAPIRKKKETEYKGLEDELGDFLAI